MSGNHGVIGEITQRNNLWSRFPYSKNNVDLFEIKKKKKKRKGKEKIYLSIDSPPCLDIIYHNS